MNSKTTTQKIGWVIFTIGAVYMIGLGWLYSWRVVPEANQFGSDAFSGHRRLVDKFPQTAPAD